MGTPFLGEIKIVSFNFPPKGWAFCNGQLLPINQNQALFSLLGTQYGGDGQTTFALPDLRGRAPVHFGDGVVIGQAAGAETHTLTQAEMPAHTHSAGSDLPATLGNPTGAVWARSVGEAAFAGAPTGSMSSNANASVGGNQAHENMQPFLTLQFVIALVGAFPSQN